MIYICGDSFGVSDLEWGIGWMDQLADSFPVTNLSTVCASNLMIAQQVDMAIQQKPDLVIVLCTASTRGQTQKNKKIIPYSIYSLNHTTSFNQRQLSILKEYTTEFFDMELAIYENQLIIEAMLQRLQDANVNFVFDQGGFEHLSYGSGRKYFDKFDSHRSIMNLWDYAQTRNYRPYHHIDNLEVHEKIANYYTTVYRHCQ